MSDTGIVYFAIKFEDGEVLLCAQQCPEGDEFNEVPSVSLANEMLADIGKAIVDITPITEEKYEQGTLDNIDWSE